MDNEDNNKKNINNIVQGDISQDSFFDTSLDNVDLSNLDTIDLSKIGVTPEEAKKVVEEDINISLPKVKPKYMQADPVIKEPQIKVSKKESDMKKILNSIGADDSDDPNKDPWSTFNSTDDSSEYKIQLHRLEPQLLKGVKISGYLETFYLPITVPDIIEKVGRTHGGGKYQLKIIDGNGKYVKMKTFDIAGIPKIEDKKEENSTPFSQTSSMGNSYKRKEEEAVTRELEESEDENNSLEEDSEEENYSNFFKKPSLRPRTNSGGGFGYPNQGYNGFSGGFGGQGGFGFRKTEEDLEQKLESKIDTKFSSLNEKLSALANQLSSKKESNSILSPELLQAAMPLIGTFLESKGSKDNMLAQQFSEMNSRMVNLFQGIQDMARSNEKSKEEILEKERREREDARKEWQQTQEKQEARFREMMMTMQTSLEKRFTDEASTQRSIRDDYEKQREEARRRQDEILDKIRQKDEESRIKIEEIREQARKVEMEKERESRRSEIEIIERMRALELDKLQYQQDHIRKNYADNIGTKEYEYKMQLALGNLNKERDSQLQDLKAQMEIEKLKNDAKLELARIKQESDEKKNSEDAFDQIMSKYLHRRLQVMMMKDLEGVEADDEGDQSITPGKVFNNVLNQGSAALGNILQQILSGGVSIEPRPERSGKIVEPKAAPKPRPNPTPVQPKAQETQSQPSETSPEVAEEEMEEEETEEGGGLDLSDLGALGPELVAEVDKIAKYFAYLKESIEQNKDPKESAEVGKQQLLPQIAQYLGTIEDSRIVIQELQGLLTPELAEYFLQENSTKWLDKLLTYFKEEA